MISKPAATLRCYGLLGLFIILSLTAPAQAQVTVRHDFVASLNETNIRAFLEEMEKIENNQRPDLSSDEIGTYLANHLTDNGTYASAVHLELPGKPPQDKTVTLTKQQFIDGVMKNDMAQQDYHSTIDIQSLDISADGKSATLKTDTKEHGTLMITDDQGGAAKPLPIEGESICTQMLALASNILQRQKEDCQTSMKLDPWNGKPLVPAN